MLAKLFIIGGITLLLIGLALLYAPGLINWFGRLPGDLHFKRGGTRIFIPITSMIIVSLALTVIVNLFLRR